MRCKKGERWRQRGKRGTGECAREERERNRQKETKRERERERERDRKGNKERETEDNREIREWKRKMQNVK